MERSKLSIRRWVATVVVFAAFAGGGPSLARIQGLGGSHRPGLAQRADRRGAKCAAGKLGEFRKWIFRSNQARITRRGEYPNFKDGEVAGKSGVAIF